MVVDERARQTLREMPRHPVRGGALDAQDIAALDIAIGLGEIDLYREHGLGPDYHYNVWDNARRERVEVHAWLARQEVRHGGE